MKIMGMGVPEMMILLPGIIIAIACCFACQKIGEKKGYSVPLFGAMGLFLGLLGLLIAAVLPDKKAEKLSSADGLLKYKQLLDSGAITQSEYDAKKRELLS